MPVSLVIPADLLHALHAAAFLHAPCGASTFPELRQSILWRQWWRQQQFEPDAAVIRHLLHA